MSGNDFETPVKETVEKEPMFTTGGVEESRKMVESKYEVNER